jgi:hypothetical protein
MTETRIKIQNEFYRTMYMYSIMEELDQRSLLPLVKHPEDKNVASDYMDRTPFPRP